MKIQGIKEICSKSKKCKGDYGNYFIQVLYNKAENRAFYEEHCDKNSYCICNNSNIYNIGVISQPMKMVDIETMIIEEMYYYNH